MSAHLGSLRRDRTASPRQSVRRRISSNRLRRTGLLNKTSYATLVVPCHNEALRLDVSLIRKMLARSPDWHWMFVDDGSTDGTALILSELEREEPHRVSVLQLPHQAGKAEAVRQGLLTALEQLPSPKYLGYLDADFSTPPESLIPFRELLERRSDLQGVMGVRLDLNGRKIKRELHKSFFNKLLAWLASGVLGVRFRDPTCGAKLLRVTPELRSALNRPFQCRGIFDIELISRLAMYYDRSGLGPIEWTLYEYPLELWNDVAGSHRQIDDYWDAFWDLGRIYWDQTWHAMPKRDAQEQALLEQELAAEHDQHAETNAANNGPHVALTDRLFDQPDQPLDSLSLASELSELDPDREAMLIEKTLAETLDLDEANSRIMGRASGEFAALVDDNELNSVTEADDFNEADFSDLNLSSASNDDEYADDGLTEDDDQSVDRQQRSMSNEHRSQRKRKRRRDR